MKPLYLVIALAVIALAGSVSRAADACCKDKASCCDAKAKAAQKADTSVKGAQLLVKK